MNFSENYLTNIKFEFNRYKIYGDRTLDQLSEKDLHWRQSADDNSIAIIIKHVVGNMLSRWTNFLMEDGEKSWRDRDQEFENPPQTKKDLIEYWEKGWQCLFNALDTVNGENFDSTIKIRGEEHTIIQAVNRQLAHYASHVGQLVLLGKMLRGKNWQSLSVTKGKSQEFNQKMFDKNS